MNKYRFLSLVFFLTGVVLLIVGGLKGEVETGFVLFFPFIVGSGIYAFLGVISIFVSIVLYMFSFTTISNSKLKDVHREEEVEEKKDVKGGGVVLIGPIPIVFGSNWKVAVLLMLLALVLIVVSVLFFNFL